MKKLFLIAVGLLMPWMAFSQTSQYDPYYGFNGGYRFYDQYGRSTGGAQYDPYAGFNGGYRIYDGSGGSQGSWQYDPYAGFNGGWRFHQ